MISWETKKTIARRADIYRSVLLKELTPQFENTIAHLNSQVINLTREVQSLDKDHKQLIKSSSKDSEFIKEVRRKGYLPETMVYKLHDALDQLSTPGVMINPAGPVSAARKNLSDMASKFPKDASLDDLLDDPF
jgi:hypothetical protein